MSFAAKALQVLEAADMVDPTALVGAIKPALWNRHKSTVRLALQLLAQTARKHPATRPEVGAITMEALAHESPDVHKLALDLLEKHAGPVSADLARALSERLDHVAASQRSRLHKLIATASPAPMETPDENAEPNEPKDEQETALRQRARALPKKWRQLAGVDDILSALEETRGGIPAIDFDPMALPRLDRDRRIEPIRDLDELIDVFAHVVEEPDDPVEVERVLDGVSRLCDQRPDDFASRTGPLRKRALHRLARMAAGPFIGCGVLADLCGVARAGSVRRLSCPSREEGIDTAALCMTTTTTTARTGRAS